MSLRDLAVLATESVEGGEVFISPYAVGGGILAFLLIALVALLMFGAGREHS